MQNTARLLRFQYVPKKPSIDEYRLQLIEALGFDDLTAARQEFEVNIRAARQTLEQSAVFEAVTSELRLARTEYAPGRDELLFLSDVTNIRFETKRFDSVINKIYRRNVLYNRSYPAPPRDGDIRLFDFYEKLNDLMRTRIICKYMDGPRYVCERLAAKCQSLGTECSYKELSTDNGYYAWHFYFKSASEINVGPDVVVKLIWVEIQFTTQLCEVITILTHDLYETRRLNAEKPPNRDWKWEPSSTEFRSAYLGHGLHLLEGIILALKDDILRSPGGERATSLERGFQTTDNHAPLTSSDVVDEQQQDQTWP